MNEQQGFWWDLIKEASSIIAVGAATGLGWLTRKFTTVEVAMKSVRERIDAVEGDLTERAQVAAMNIVRLEAYHVANTQRLDSIDDRTRGIDSKLDRLIESMTSKRRSRS